MAEILKNFLAFLASHDMLPVHVGMANRFWMFPLVIRSPSPPLLPLCVLQDLSSVVLSSIPGLSFGNRQLVCLQPVVICRDIVFIFNIYFTVCFHWFLKSPTAKWSITIFIYLFSYYW